MLAAVPAAVLGGAWYASGRLLAVTPVHDTYPLHVIAVNALRRTIVLTRGRDAAEPGTFRLAWPDGHALAGPVIGSTRRAVTRRLWAVHGRLGPGRRVGIEPNRYTGDPRSALHLRFSTARVPSALGGMPAWLVPGRRRTWVILVHGLGGSRVDVLPAMSALRRLGYPMLAISYRNDPGAPRSRDHRTHLGETESRDLAAAVVYAKLHGAGGVVLYGYSMGGAMALLTARDRRLGPDVRAVVLDSPVLDWPPTIAYDAGRRGIPSPLARLIATLVAWRAGLDYQQTNQFAHSWQLHVPVLLVQGGADTVVPPSLADRFAHARPDLVDYIRVPGADHVSSIDTDPTRYRQALRRFLARYR